MNFTLHVWRQNGAQRQGRRWTTYQAKNVSPDMSFLEMLDVVNQELIEKGEEPIAFDHDCREGICGIVLPDDQRRAARPADPAAARPTCQTYMRNFKDGETIYVEPWRAGRSR